jgi:hypothetical protein
MGRRGRHLVETELSPERHYARLMQVYERAIARHRPRADGRLCAVMDEFSKGNEQR